MAAVSMPSFEAATFQGGYSAQTFAPTTTQSLPDAGFSYSRAGTVFAVESRTHPGRHPEGRAECLRQPPLARHRLADRHLDDPQRLGVAQRAADGRARHAVASGDRLLGEAVLMMEPGDLDEEVSALALDAPPCRFHHSGPYILDGSADRSSTARRMRCAAVNRSSR